MIYTRERRVDGRAGGGRGDGIAAVDARCDGGVLEGWGGEGEKGVCRGGGEGGDGVVDCGVGEGGGREGDVEEGGLGEEERAGWDCAGCEDAEAGAGGGADLEQ